ncbi:MAG TPA: hypothetical protein DCX29_12945 [Hyphomonas sp.]|nr:hypothetical protein [Hyphomonas sp.]
MSRTSDLQALLEAQHISPDSREMAELQNHRAGVEAAIRAAFHGASISIQYGGSKKKGTMIKESYDLDIIVYAYHDETRLGENLSDIYNNVATALSPDYFVHPKTSALRLYAKADGARGDRLHIDVVPGRYVDESRGDAYLHQNSGQKSRLKTNLQTHVDHIKTSGVIGTLKLGKLARVRYDLDIKQFALDLVLIELLKGKTAESLDQQFTHVLQIIADRSTPITIEDPANPAGNDLSGLLDTQVWSELRNVATTMLNQADSGGWGLAFGEAENLGPASAAIITRAAETVDEPTKPWAR